MRQKYLVLRRDGSIPDWPAFVLAAADPAAPRALRAYADECERLEMSSHYVREVRQIADEFERFSEHWGSQPDEPDRRATCQFVHRLLDTRASTTEAET